MSVSTTVFARSVKVERRAQITPRGGYAIQVTTFLFLDEEGRTLYEVACHGKNAPTIDEIVPTRIFGDVTAGGN